MIKALFFDIDGTLVSFKTHRMSENLKTALTTLQKKGIKLFIASGRTILVMDNLEGFPFDGYITMNGAQTFYNGEVIDEHPLPPKTALQVAQIAESETAPCWIFADDLVCINRMNDESTEVSGQLNLFPEHFSDIVAVAKEHKVFQFTIYFDKEREDRLLRTTLKDVDYARWHPYFVDVLPSGLSKAYGASKVLERLGLTKEECMAFGDGGNDVDILQYSGIGVAMGNAEDGVKEKADYVTDSVDEDGVVTALKHFGLLN